MGTRGIDCENDAGDNTLLRRLSPRQAHIDFPTATRRWQRIYARSRSVGLGTDVSMTIRQVAKARILLLDAKRALLGPWRMPEPSLADRAYSSPECRSSGVQSSGRTLRRLFPRRSTLAQGRFHHYFCFVISARLPRGIRCAVIREA